MHDSMTVPNREPWDALAADLGAQAGALRRIVRALCGPTDPDDAVQGAVVVALEHAAPAGARPVGWLAGLVRNVARNSRRAEFRRRAREQARATPEALDSAAARAERLELEARLAAYVRELPAAQCEVLYLRFWEDLPPRAIAARLELDVEAVKSRQKRALAALRERLDRESGGTRAAWLSALGALSPVETSAGSTGAAASLGLGALLFGIKQIVAALVVVALGLSVWWKLSSAPAPAPPPNAASLSPLAAATSDDDASETAALPPAARTPAPAERVIPAGTFVIRGRVLDVPLDAPRERGASAAGVPIRAASFGLGEKPAVDVGTTTDEEGRFELECSHDKPKALRVTVSAEANEAFNRSSAQLDLDAAGAQVHELVLERFENGTLAGVVVDLRNEPIEGATIELRDDPQDNGVSTTSDERGAFAFERPRKPAQVRAKRVGYTPVTQPYAQRGERGGWKPALARMSRSATLVVAFEDERGQPIAGATVIAAISEAERIAGAAADVPQRTIRVGPDGIARFDDLWAELRLDLTIELGGATWKVAHALDGVALLGAPSAGARPIVLAPAAVQSLTVRLGAVRTLRGIVVDSNGQPRAKAGVRAASLGVPRTSPRFVHARATSGDDGRFELAVCPLDAGARLLVIAANGPDYLFSATESASALVDLGPTSADEELRLALAPLPSISGRVVDAGGLGTAAGIQVFPADDAAIATMFATRHNGRTDAAPDGTFAMRGLPLGRYELVAHGPQHAPASACIVAAGTSDVLIRLGQPMAVRIAIAVEPPAGEELESCVVMYGQLDVPPGAPIDAPLLPEHSTWIQPNGWPEQRANALPGIATSAASEGPVEFFTRALPKSGEFTLSIQPGWHWFGAKARTKSGSECFPTCTGLVRVGSGEHRLVFRLQGAASVRGRASGLGTPSEVRVAVFCAGEPVPLSIGRKDERRTFVELGADGSFALDLVPAGKIELRAGTREELERGQWRARAELDLAPNERREVVLGR